MLLQQWVCETLYCSFPWNVSFPLQGCTLLLTLSWWNKVNAEVSLLCALYIGLKINATCLYVSLGQGSLDPSLSVYHIGRWKEPAFTDEASSWHQSGSLIVWTGFHYCFLFGERTSFGIWYLCLEVSSVHVKVFCEVHLTTKVFSAVSFFVVIHHRFINIENRKI